MIDKLRSEKWKETAVTSGTTPNLPGGKRKTTKTSK
jgi:hypothetical protein